MNDSKIVESKKRILARLTAEDLSKVTGGAPGATGTVTYPAGQNPDITNVGGDAD